MNITNCTNHTILAHNVLETLTDINRPERGFNDSMLAVSPPTFEYLRAVCAKLDAEFQLNTTGDPDSTSFLNNTFQHLGPITHCIRHCLAMIAYQPRIFDAYEAVRFINIPHEDRPKHLGLSVLRLAAFGNMVRQFDTTCTSISANIAQAISSAVLEQEFVTIYLILLGVAVDADTDPIPIINPHTYHDQRDKFSGVAG